MLEDCTSPRRVKVDGANLEVLGKDDVYGDFVDGRMKLRWSNQENFSFDDSTKYTSFYLSLSHMPAGVIALHPVYSAIPRSWEDDPFGEKNRR